MYSTILKDSKIDYIRTTMHKKIIYSCCTETLIPVRDTLEVFGGKWKLPILISIMAGNERFTDIQKSIPNITPKVLTKELKSLEEHQLIKRVIIEDYPIKILYKAQPYVETIRPMIEALKIWGVNHRKKLFNQEPIEK